MLVEVEIIGAMGWVGVGSVGASWVLLLLAALRYGCTLSRWNTKRAEGTDFCKIRRDFNQEEQVADGQTKRNSLRDRIKHMMQTEMVLTALLFARSTWKLNHPHDLLQRLSVLSCSATIALAVALYWIRASGVPAEELGPTDFAKMGVFAVGVLSPPIWLLETAFLWLRRPVLDVIELGLEDVEERANWNRLRCMPKRVVPYRVAQRCLAGEQIKTDEVEALQRVEAPYFERKTDATAIPKLLGEQASQMQRHEPWLWHMGAAWLCWSQLEASDRRDAGHGAALWVMEHIASHGRLASQESFGPDGLRAQKGAKADRLVGLSGRSVEQEADYRLWHALSLVGEILAQLDAWAIKKNQLRKVAKRARKEVRKQQKLTPRKLDAELGTDPLKVAASTADRLIVCILGLESPGKALARGNSAAGAARGFMKAAIDVCDECRQRCAAWEGPDDTRFVAALHCAARGMWVFVRDHLHQCLRREKVAVAPFAVAQMPQYVREPEDGTLVLYRSSAEQRPASAGKPFAQRRLRPGEEQLLGDSTTVILPRREKEGFGFHINEDGIVDGLAKTENGAQIAKGVSIGMRLLAVDTVMVCSTTQVFSLLEKHAAGRAARFELRPAPPPADQVFAEKRREKAAKQAAIDAATLAASKPYGNRIMVTCPEDTAVGTQLVINDALVVTVPAGVKPGEQFKVLPVPNADEGSTTGAPNEFPEWGNLPLSSYLTSSLNIVRLDVWQAEQEKLEQVQREKQRLLEAVPSSAADAARQEVALMAERPDLHEAQEDLADWLGKCNATKQENKESERAVREQSADAEQVVAAIEHAVWEKLCEEQARCQEQKAGAAAIGQALVLHNADVDNHDTERLIARRPRAFFLPGLLGVIFSGASGAWMVWVDQELQSERLAVKPVGLPLVAFGADAGLLLRVWVYIAVAALLTKFVLIDVAVVVGSVVCCKDYSISDLSKPVPEGVQRPSSALSRPSSAATTVVGSLQSRPSSAVAQGAMTTARESDDDDIDSMVSSSSGELPGCTGSAEVREIENQSLPWRPNSASAVIGLEEGGSISARSILASSKGAKQVLPVGSTENPQSRRPKSAGTVVRFEGAGSGLCYEL